MAPVSKLALSLLAAPLCHAFAPSAQNAAHQTILLASNEDAEFFHSRPIAQASKVAASSILALSLVAFAPNSHAAVSTPAYTAPLTSSILTSATTPNDDDQAALSTLQAETKALERETALLKKKARIERGREAFYDYEAKMAAETEARIEAAERSAEIEYENDKAEVEALALLELKKERDAKLASSPREKRELEKEARLLQAKEREIARKEKRAARREKIYLAEETREKEILKQKTDAARREDAKFEEVESEYEKDAELVVEEEAELKSLKDLMRRTK